MRLKNLVCAAALLFFSAINAHAIPLTVGWDPPVADPAVTISGYNIYWGTKTQDYPNNKNVGSGLTYTFSPELTAAGTYYIVATAYSADDAESDYSNELVVQSVTLNQSAGGVISSGDFTTSFFCTNGDTVLFSIIPSNGFKVKDVVINGVSLGRVTSVNLTVTSPQTITAVFAKKPGPPRNMGRR